MKSLKQILNKSTKSLEELSKKHKISIDHLQNQLNIGMKIEKEHTTHDNVAKEIAMDHLGEDPYYYTKLKKMES